MNALVLAAPLALSFAGSAMRALPSRAGKVVMSDDLSAAIPFVKKPKNLNGELLLDIGFDPAGFTNGVDAAQIENFRVAELKHGRVCMLAATGFLIQGLSTGIALPYFFPLPHLFPFLFTTTYIFPYTYTQTLTNTPLPPFRIPLL